LYPNEWVEWSIRIAFLFGNFISSEIWSRDVIDNGYLLYFRWWELLVEPRKGFGQIRPVVLSNHHPHLQIWPKLWPDKQSFSINWYKLKWATSVNNPEAAMNL
jgi:hypothetical protein